MPDNEILGSEGDNNSRLLIEQLPKTALQAIYHAATGKTETYRKDIKGNVIISFSDIAHLHESIKQKMEHYEIITNPTVTIVVKQDNNRSLQYSSWERFDLFQAHGNEITSEVLIKYELLIKLPSTDSPQRLIINISFDSGLPVIFKDEMEFLEFAPPEVVSFLLVSFRTVTVSIDFVDFLLAKGFCDLIEEWFNALENVPKPRFSEWIAKAMPRIIGIVNQFSRIGLAVFLSSYVYINDGNPGSPGEIIYVISLGLFVWSIISILMGYQNKIFVNRVIKNILPSVIVLTKSDESAFEKVKSRITEPRITFFGVVATVLGSLALNVLSSYVASFFFSN